MSVDRGDLIYINFNSNNVPAIVLSPKKFNEITNFISICPITSVQKGWGYEVDLPKGLVFDGVILTDQIKNINLLKRQIEKKGKAPYEIVRECLDKISTFLYY